LYPLEIIGISKILRKGVTPVVPVKETCHHTSYRQPCNTW
jgi:hypothetical protein